MKEVMIEVKFKITGTEKWLIPVAFPEFNQESWDNELQTPQSQEKKCKNFHTRVGKTNEVWRVGGWAFAPTFARVYFSLFFQPDFFFNTTWAI